MSYRMKRLAALLCGTIMISTLTVNMSGCGKSEVGAAGTETEDTASIISGEGVITTSMLQSADMFSDRDKEVGCDESTASSITLADGKSESDDSSVKVEDDTVTITKEGTYIVTGKLSNGQLVVDLSSEDDNAKVHLVLNGVEINCNTSAAVYVKEADKVFVTLAEGSENKLSNAEEYVAIDDNNINAVLFAKDDLTINGSGTLEITAKYGSGISCKDELAITGGNYSIEAETHAIAGKDCVKIADGNFKLTAGKDGIHSANSDDENKGYVYIENGTFEINSEGDGIDSSNVVQIENGDINIVAGGGSANALQKQREGMPQGGGRNWAKKDSAGSEGNDSTDGAGSEGRGNMGDGMVPPSGDMPDGMTPPSGDMPGGMTPPSGDMPGGMTPPNGNMQEGQNSDGTASSGKERRHGGRQDKSTNQNSNEGNQSEAGVPSEGGATSEDSKTTGGSETSGNSGATDEDTTSMKGIKADKNIFFNGGKLTIDSADDAVHSNGSVDVEAGEYTLTTGDDGVHAGEDLVINDGTIEVTKSYEGLEGKTITVNAGKININASDDGMNAAGGNDSSGTAGGFGKDSFGNSEDSWININGGYVYVNANGDGIDSNGDLNINGGEIYVEGPTSGGDASLDYGDGATSTITGGTVVALGSSGMAENFSDTSSQGAILYVLDETVTGDMTLTDEEGNTVASFTTTKNYNCVQISSSELEKGKTYTLKAGDATATIEMEDILYSNSTGTGFGGMKGGHGNQGAGIDSNSSSVDESGQSGDISNDITNKQTV